MPRGNGTGPMGMGSMTGRGQGLCAGNNTPGAANGGGWTGQGRGSGMGFARGCRGTGGGGRGLGRGARNMTFVAGTPGQMGAGFGSGSFGNPNPEWEKRMLSNQADALQRELEGVKKRLSDMETKKE